MSQHRGVWSALFLKAFLIALLCCALGKLPVALALRNPQLSESGLEEFSRQLVVPPEGPLAMTSASPQPDDPGRLRRASDAMKQWLMLKYGRLPDSHPLNVYAQGALQEAFGEDGGSYRVIVLPEWREINALAFPDGTVLISSGLLAFAQYREELKAVLAHEVTHARRTHAQVQLQQFESALKDKDRSIISAVVQQIGLRRLHEYDADLRWMFDKAHPVNVNPWGQVVFQERLYDHEKTYLGGHALDFTHGTLQDRALNTESLFYLMDLNTLSRDLGVVPPEIRRQARQLPRDQIYFFQRIGSYIQGGEYDRIQARRRAIAEQLPLAQLGFALGGIWGLLDDNVHDDRQLAQRRLMQQLDERVDQELLPVTQWPDPAQRSAARALLYELHAGIPYVMLPGTSVRFRVVSGLADRHRTDGRMMATAEGMALLPTTLLDQKFQTLPIPATPISPTDLTRRFATTAIRRFRLASRPTKAAIEQYIRLMGMWARAVDQYYAIRGVGIQAAGRGFVQALGLLEQALGRRQTLIEHAKACAEQENLITPSMQDDAKRKKIISSEVIEREANLHALIRQQPPGGYTLSITGPSCVIWKLRCRGGRLKTLSSTSLSSLRQLMSVELPRSCD